MWFGCHLGEGLLNVSGVKTKQGEAAFSFFMHLHLRTWVVLRISALLNRGSRIFCFFISFIPCTALQMHCNSYFVFRCCFCILPCVCFVSGLNAFMSSVKHSSSFIQKKLYILFDTCVCVCVFMWIPSRSFHPYANPEVLSFPVEDGSLAYMKWMDEAIPDDWCIIKIRAKRCMDCSRTRTPSRVHRLSF